MKLNIEISKNSIILLIIEAILFLGLLSCISTCSNRKINTLDNNLNATMDSLEVVQLENGNLLADRQAYIAKEKDLLNLLDMTKKEKKDIEKKLNDKIAFISNIESHIQVDTIEIKDTVIINNDSTININFRHSDKWLSLNGFVKYEDKMSTTYLHNVAIPVPLKVGLTEEFNIFVETSNPYISITNIEGVVVDKSKIYPKKQKWNFSIHGGIGVHYGLFGQQIDVGPYIGAGISYNF